MDTFSYTLWLAATGLCLILAATLGWYLLHTRKEPEMPEILEAVATVPNQIIKAADSVLETGMKEKFDISFTVFGRKLGVFVEVSLLSKEPGR